MEGGKFFRGRERAPHRKREPEREEREKESARNRMRDIKKSLTHKGVKE